MLFVMLPDTGERYLGTYLFDDVTEGSHDDWLKSLGCPLRRLPCDQGHSTPSARAAVLSFNTSLSGRFGSGSKWWCR